MMSGVGEERQMEIAQAGPQNEEEEKSHHRRHLEAGQTGRYVKSIPNPRDYSAYTSNRRRTFLAGPASSVATTADFPKSGEVYLHPKRRISEPAVSSVPNFTSSD